MTTAAAMSQERMKTNEESPSPTPNPLTTFANGDLLTFVGPEPHSVAPLKTPVAPVGEGSNVGRAMNNFRFKQLTGFVFADMYEFLYSLNL